MANCPLQYQPPSATYDIEPTRMVKSVILTGHGGIEKIKVGEAPIPVEVIGDNVEVEVHYCGLSFTDNYLRLGIIRSDVFPVIMGSECAGVVTRVGSDVSEYKAGDRVLCIQLQGGLFRHVVQVHKRYCFPIPDNVNLCHAVCLGLNFIVAHLCLFELGNLKTTQIVFMQSIGGGVGTALIQLARTVPLVRIMGTASEAKHQQLMNLRANRIYCHCDNYVDRILNRYPEGVDLIINSNGGSDMDKLLKMLRWCGKIINIGSNSSAIYPRNYTWGLKRPSWDNKTVAVTDIMKRTYNIAGLNIGILLEKERSKVESALSEVFKLYTRGKVQPRAHNVLAFDRVADGMTQLCKRENYGKVVLAVVDSAQIKGPESKSSFATEAMEA